MGGGEYGVKIVTNTRGKLRRVHWNRLLFKAGSFNKLKVRESGWRVRTKERMREIEQDKAEAKFVMELKQTKKELVVTLAGYCVHSTVVPAIVPKNIFAPSEEIDGKELLFSNGGGCYK
jgi:hypothetical protein